MLGVGSISSQTARSAQILLETRNVPVLLITKHAPVGCEVKSYRLVD
jgi:hypothetical protein